MNGYLIDTNVFSELTKPSPFPRVEDFFADAKLPDDEIPPDEYVMRIRFELDKTTNKPNGAGAPEVLDFSIPPPPPMNRPAHVKPFPKQA